MVKLKRDVRVYADLSPKRFKTGYWSFWLHRISGVAILFFLLMHIWEITSVTRGGAQHFDVTMSILGTKPFVIGEFMLFLALTFHMLNGIRLMLHDRGIGVRQQKTYFWVVFGLSAVVVLAGAPFFVRRFIAYPWTL